MISLKEILSGLDFRVFKRLGVHHAGQIIRYGIMTHLQSKGVEYLDKRFWKRLGLKQSKNSEIEAWEIAENLYVREFTKKFCDNNGAIDWEKLIKFNKRAPASN